MSRKLGDAGVSINLVYTNTRLVFGADASPEQRQRSRSSQYPEMAA